MPLRSLKLKWAWPAYFLRHTLEILGIVIFFEDLQMILLSFLEIFITKKVWKNVPRLSVQVWRSLCLRSTLNKPWGGGIKAQPIRRLPLTRQTKFELKSPFEFFFFFMFRTSHYLQFWRLYLEWFRKFIFLRKNIIKKPWGGGIKMLPFMAEGMDRQTLKLK